MIERIEVKNGKEGYLFDKYDFITSIYRTASGATRLTARINDKFDVCKDGDWLVCEDGEWRIEKG